MYQGLINVPPRASKREVGRQPSRMYTRPHMGRHSPYPARVHYRWSEKESATNLKMGPENGGNSTFYV